jgi:hypothetical protein
VKFGAVSLIRGILVVSVAVSVLIFALLVNFGFLNCRPALSISSTVNEISDEKRNPPASSGGLGNVYADPYPHDSGHMRQHGAPALEGQNM